MTRNHAEAEKLRAEWLREHEWREKSAGRLVEVTALDHQYLGRIGQPIGASYERFVGIQPFYKAGNEYNLHSSQIKPSVTVNFGSEILPLPEGTFRVIQKAGMREGEIEVVDESGRVGVLLDWQDTESGRFYTARFGNRVVEERDDLTFGSPHWVFRRPGNHPQP